jgi:hypothetical protein
MRSQTLAIFFVVIFLVVALSLAEVTVYNTMMYKRGYGSDTGSNPSPAPNAPNTASTVEWSIITAAIMLFAGLIAY